MKLLFLLSSMWLAAAGVLPAEGGARPGAANREYGFQGRIDRKVLEDYLSRAITFCRLLEGKGNFKDNLRLLKECGVKFVGRALFMWGGEGRLESLLSTAAPLARKVHDVDPEIILQAAIFEIVTTEVEKIRVPRAVFEEFGLEPQERNFRYRSMIYPEGHRVNQWRPGASVPDMSRIETQMWFLHLARCTIDVGIEAIHFGQVEIMDDRDPDRAAWRGLLARARAYAARKARRKLLLCDAHVPSGGIVHEGKLLFDFHSFPLRIEEVPDKRGEAVLKVGYLDSIFGRSRGGITPSGWKCDHLPFLVELDNYGQSSRPGENVGGYWVWGYDEISWFAHQSREYRNRWLRYAWRWVREHDPAGYLQMPGSRPIHPPAGGRNWYFANMPGKACPSGFGQETTIRDIWAEAGGD